MVCVHVVLRNAPLLFARLSSDSYESINNALSTLFHFKAGYLELLRLWDGSSTVWCYSPCAFFVVIFVETSSQRQCFALVVNRFFKFYKCSSHDMVATLPNVVLQSSLDGSQG